MRRTGDPQAIIFDFDGTLVASHIDFDLMRQRVVEHLRAWGLEPEEAGTRLILEAVNWARNSLAAVSPERAEQYAREARAIIWEVERPFCETAAPYPGVPEALKRVSAAGLRLGIITRNSRAGVGLVLARHPLPVSVVVTREDLEEVKPDPQHLHMALEQLNCPPEQSWLVGDHPTDIICGREAGARTCAILTTGTPAEEFLRLGADLVCADVPEFVAWLMGEEEA